MFQARPVLSTYYPAWQGFNVLGAASTKIMLGSEPQQNGLSSGLLPTVHQHSRILTSKSAPAQTRTRIVMNNDDCVEPGSDYKPSEDDVEGSCEESSTQQQGDTEQTTPQLKPESQHARSPKRYGQVTCCFCKEGFDKISINQEVCTKPPCQEKKGEQRKEEKRLQSKQRALQAKEEAQAVRAQEAALASDYEPSEDDVEGSFLFG